VGLCCIEIFGYTDPRAKEYAVNLGIALQMTNILRDLSSDLERGRIYLPLEDLRRFGVSSEALRLGRYTDAFVELMRFEAQRARGFYSRAAETFPKADSRRLLAAVIMGQIYYALLEAIEARGFRVFDGRVRVPVSTKVAIALRCWAGTRLGVAA
jgi:phytoene synthase